MSMEINRISNRTILRVLGIITGFVLSLEVAWLVRQQLVWILSAAFLAIALNPAVSWLSRFMPRKSRGLAIVTVFLATIGLISFLAIALLPPLFNQTQELVKSFPTIANNIRESHNLVGNTIRHYDVVGQLQAQAAGAAKSFGSVSGSVLGFVSAIFGSLLATLTIMVLTYFMLIEGPGVIERLWSYHPTPTKERNQKLVQKMYASVTGYVIGNVLTSVICGAVTWVFLALVGVPYALPVALIVALLDLVPMVGATLGATVGVVVALSQSVPLAVGTLAFFLVYQQIENNILQPYVYGKTIQISPLAVFISAMLGVAIGGLLGAVVAVPVGASLAIVGREVLAVRRKKSTAKS